MAATPQYGACMFRGVRTGQLYPTDCYVSDVAGAKIRWDGGSGAGAATDDFVTFNEPVILEDFSVITGCADTEKWRVTADAKPLPHVIRYSLHLNTLNNRPKLNIPFKANTRISGFQIAD
jgi:hypothetical protein